MRERNRAVNVWRTSWEHLVGDKTKMSKWMNQNAISKTLLMFNLLIISPLLYFADKILHSYIVSLCFSCPWQHWMAIIRRIRSPFKKLILKQMARYNKILLQCLFKTWSTTIMTQEKYILKATQHSFINVFKNNGVPEGYTRPTSHQQIVPVHRTWRHKRACFCQSVCARLLMHLFVRCETQHARKSWIMR